MGGSGGGGSGWVNPIRNPLNEWINKNISEKVTPEWAVKMTDKNLPEAVKGAVNDIAPTLEETGGGGGDGGMEEPTIAEAQGVANTKVSAKRKAIARSRSIFTSPLGLGGFAGLARKFLLGE